MNTHLLFTRDDCVTCGATPSCDCPKNTQCQLTGRTCQQCPQIQCIPVGGSGGGGVNPGAIAGPVAAVLVLASVGLFWWLRRKKRRDLAQLEDFARQAKAHSVNLQLPRSGANSPAPLSAHSSQRLDHPAGAGGTAAQAEYYDSDGALVRVYAGNQGFIDLRNEKTARPFAYGGGNAYEAAQNQNPFDDRHSLTSSKATSHSGQSAHIIPIQYVPSPTDRHVVPSRSRNALQTLTEARANLLQPRRPARAPDLDLRLNPPPLRSTSQPSRDLLSPTNAGNRASYHSSTSVAPSFMTGMTGMTGMTDVHAEAPKIVMSRQVHVGRVQQAEVVRLEALGSAGPGGYGGQGQTRSGGQGMEALQESARASGLTFGPLALSGEAGAGGSGVLRDQRTDSPFANADADTEADDENLSAPSFPPTGDMRFSLSSLAYSDGHPHQLPPTPGGAGIGPGPRDSVFSTHSGRSAADSFLSAFPMIPPGHPAARALVASGRGGELPQSTSVATLNHVAFARSGSGLGSGLGTGMVTRGGGGSVPSSAMTSSLAAAGGSRPPTSFRSPGPSSLGSRQAPSRLDHQGQQNGVSRPVTAFSTQSGLSVADSLLGTFPFIPPRGVGGDFSARGDSGAEENAEEMVVTPTRADDGRGQGAQAQQQGDGEAAARKTKGRLTLGLSTMSEGLGAFDFAFPVPPVPRTSSGAAL